MRPPPGSAARIARSILGSLERSVSPGVKVGPQRPMSLRSALGIPQISAVAQGLPAIAVMLCFAGAVFGVLYLVFTIGVWLVVGLLWLAILGLVWRVRSRIRWDRLRDIVTDRRP